MSENKNQYYASLNINCVIHNEIFSRVKGDIATTNRVIFIDSRKIITDTEKVADTFKKNFMNNGNSLKIDKDKPILV